MCLRFMFLLTTRLTAWLRLARREETWKTAEILILCHELLAAGRLSGVQHLSAGYRPQAEARADTPAGREVSGCQSATTLFLTCYRGRRTTSRSTPGSSTGHI